MAVQNSTTLKSYYETGDKPTQQQFEDLIDSLQEARDNATVALASALSAQTVSTSALSAANLRVLRAGDTMTGALAIAGSANSVQLQVTGATGQTAGLLDLQVFGGTSVLTVGISGGLTITRGSLTADSQSISDTATWNNGAVTFTGWKMDVTDTASAAASLLLDLQVGSTSMFNVSKVGNVTAVNIFSVPSTLTYAATTNIDFLAGGDRNISLTGDIEFTTSNLAAGRNVVIHITCDATPRNFTFPAWVFMGSAAPTSIDASKTAVLSLNARSTTDASVQAVYVVEP